MRTEENLDLKTETLSESRLDRRLSDSRLERRTETKIDNYDFLALNMIKRIKLCYLHYESTLNLILGFLFVYLALYESKKINIIYFYIYICIFIEGEKCNNLKYQCFIFGMNLLFFSSIKL